MIDRGGMDNRSSVVGRGSVDNGSFGIDSSSLVGNISNVSFIAISLVVHMLGTAIRKGNGIRSCSISSTITSLSSIEGSL